MTARTFDAKFPRHSTHYRLLLLLLLLLCRIAAIAAYCYTRSSIVGRSVDMLVTFVSPVKTITDRDAVWG